MAMSTFIGAVYYGARGHAQRGGFLDNARSRQ